MALTQVQTGMIADGAITAEKLASGAVSNAYVGGKGQVFTSSGTFTVPADVTAVKVTVVGGGGGSGSLGANCGNVRNGGGGGGGGAIKFLTGLTPANTLTVTVGAAGAVGGTNAAGGAGGTSSVASGTQVITTVSATGGSGGAGVTSGVTATNGGAGSGGDINLTGGGAMSENSFRNNGVSPFFPSLKQVTNSVTNATAGTAYGNGSVGAYGDGNTKTGAAGAAGVVVFEW